MTYTSTSRRESQEKGELEVVEVRVKQGRKRREKKIYRGKLVDEKNVNQIDSSTLISSLVGQIHFQEEEKKKT